MLSRLRGFWSRVGILLLLAALFHLGSLDEGFLLDDHAIYARLGAWRGGMQGATWWDLFHLGSFDARLRFSGALPWWAAEDVQLHFFRPLAALTHAVDVLLWPENPALMHLHNLLWFVASGAAVAWLYRGALQSERVALLATAVFVLSYVHEWPIRWISARNAQMALTFGIVALGGFLRWRQGWRWRVAALLALTASVLSGEVGVSALAYVVAFAATRVAFGGDKPRVGLQMVASSLLVVLVWRVGYTAAGFGAVGSGTYLDPLSAGGAFLDEAPGRLGALLLFIPGPAELWMSPAVALVVRVTVGGLFLAAVGTTVMSVGRSRCAWAGGAVLCMVPLLASIPQPRLLGFVLIGVAPLVAGAIVDGWIADTRVRRFGAIVTATVLLASGPMVLSGALDGVRSAGAPELGEPGKNLGELRGRNLVVLNAPNLASAQMIGATRVAHGLELPAFSWVLGVGEDVVVRRSGCCTIVLSQPRGLYKELWSATFRGPQRPFEVGETVSTLAFGATVDDVDGRGSATRVSFEMTGPLRSPQYVFVRWDGRDYQVVAWRDIPNAEEGGGSRP